jgi:hypothetical protein
LPTLFQDEQSYKRFVGKMGLGQWWEIVVQTDWCDIHW